MCSGIMIIALFMSFIVMPSSALRELNFCSGRSFHDTFSPGPDSSESDSILSSGGLALDGSDSAIDPIEALTTDVTSCTCTMKNGGSEISKLLIHHSTDGIYKTCGKWIEIVKTGERIVHRFGCASSKSELEDILEGEDITVTLFFESLRPSDTTYKLFIAPERVFANLYVTCWPPNWTTKSTTTVTASSSTTTTKSSTSSSVSGIISTTASAGTSNKAILAVVITIASVTTILLLACIICCICRRNRIKQKKEKDKADTDIEKNASNETTQKPIHEHVYSTVSHIYASIRSTAVASIVRKKRSLPKHPLDRLRGKTKKTNIADEETGQARESGLYDSIRSHLGVGSKRLNEKNYKSVDDLPMSNTDKLVLTRLDSCESDSYIHPKANNASKTPVLGQMSTESSQYINPIISNCLPERYHEKTGGEVQQNNLSVAKLNRLHSEDYLKPVQSEKFDLERSESDETLYMKMALNQVDKKLECGENNSYMISRPRYAEGNEDNMSNKAHNQAIADVRKEDSIPSHHLSPQYTNPDSIPCHNNKEEGKVEKPSTCTNSKEDNMPVNCSKKSQSRNDRIGVNDFENSLKQSTLPKLGIDKDGDSGNTSLLSDSVSTAERLGNLGNNKACPSMTGKVLPPKLTLSVQPSGDYIPMNCTKNIKAPVTVPGLNRDVMTAKYFNNAEVLKNEEKSYENLNDFNPVNTLLSGKSDTDHDIQNKMIKAVPKLAVSIQPSGEYIPMNGSDVRDLSETKYEDSRHGEMNKMEGLCDKHEKKMTNVCSEMEDINHPRQFFNMADVEFGMQISATTVGNSETKGMEKPKLKRYIRNTENT